MQFPYEWNTCAGGRIRPARKMLETAADARFVRCFSGCKTRRLKQGNGFLIAHNYRLAFAIVSFSISINLKAADSFPKPMYALARSAEPLINPKILIPS